MANPFIENDPEEDKAYRKMIMSCLVGASLVVLLFLIVLYVNSSKKKTPPVSISKNQEDDTEEFVYGESNLVSSDLDFWDMYDDSEILENGDEIEGDSTSFKDGKKNKKTNSKDDLEKKDGEATGEEENDDTLQKGEEEKDRLAVTDSSGKTMYYEILENADKNTYNLSANLEKNEKGILTYKSDSQQSKIGVSLDKNSGDVDFAKVKSAGVDFCMLRIGLRGYSSGIINLDEKFVEYATNAKNNNIYIGVYFDTAAISVEEAAEEASFAVGAIGNYGIRYPVAINIGQNGMDASSRNSNLTMKERTEIVKAFCDTVKQYNYNPVIKGSRDMLISKLNLEDLKGYDIWVSDFNYPTDYPYEFNIWEYTNESLVDGINGSVSLEISFDDYSEK